MRKSIFVFATGLFSFLFTTAVIAQNRFDALRYNVLFPGNGPVSLSMGGSSVASYTGYGSYVENPATIGLAKNNLVTFSIDPRKVRESTDYLNTSTSYNDSQAGIGDLGAIYKIPTLQGSFVIGAGYTTLTDFNRASEAQAFNTNSTVADFFNNSNFYYNIAYQGFAIDSTGFGDTESILRLAQGGFKGVNQDVQTIESGKMGEIALFGSTEFLKDFYVGMSLNFPVGYYDYHRSFIEEDLQNLYQTYPYNFNYMDSEDKIHDNISGFYARVGMVYKASKWLNIGASYQTPAVMTLDENYSSSIKTVFDDGQSYPASFKGTTQYKISNPARWKLGISAHPVNDLTINFTGENIDYSNIMFKSLGGDAKAQIDANNAIRNDFKNVWNFETGLSVRINTLEPRIGFAYMPSPRKAFDASRTFYTAGLGIILQEGFTLNGGVSLGRWNDNTLLYGQGFYYNNANQLQYTAPESATQKVQHITTMIGISYRF